MDAAVKRDDKIVLFSKSAVQGCTVSSQNAACMNGVGKMGKGVRKGYVGDVQDFKTELAEAFFDFEDAVLVPVNKIY